MRVSLRNIVTLILLFLGLGCIAANAPPSQYVIGVDMGTESVRVGIFDATGKVIASVATPYKTTYPAPGHVEQNPEDWWSNLSTSCKQALNEAQEKYCISSDAIKGLCCDTTACSVLILDKQKEPMRNCLLWCDSRSAKQTERILEKGQGDPALRVNCDGGGPISAEWMLPKALWLKEHERETWDTSGYVCECQDWINYKLTNQLVASGCNVAARWHWNSTAAALHSISNSNEEGACEVGRPVSLLRLVDLEDLLIKWPQKCIPMGAKVGSLTAAAAAHLGLHEGIPVFQGGPDAYVGMIGLGCVQPGTLALITGSSHLHLAVSNTPRTAPGIWGAYDGAPLLGLCFAEGGQSSTGSIITWFKRLCNQGSVSDVSTSADKEVTFQLLDAESETLSQPGANGLLALETFQGSRTPVTDAYAKGALVGLTLAHTRADIWRALLESIALGTRSCIDSMEQAGLCSKDSDVYITGGATRSAHFLQLHADICGKTFVLGETDNAVLLGAGILAAAGIGMFDDKIEMKGAEVAGTGGEQILARVKAAVEGMVRTVRRVYPNQEAKDVYDRVWAAQCTLKEAVRRINRIQSSEYVDDATSLGNDNGGANKKRSKGSVLTMHQPLLRPALSPNRVRKMDAIHVVPSLLAGDFGHLVREAQQVAAQGCDWLHVDMCDGGHIAPGALTLGPQAVGVIHRAVPELKIDVHLVVSSPGLFVEALAKEGASRVTVQFEILRDAAYNDGGSDVAVYGILKAFIMHVHSYGMEAGLCVAPETDIEEVCTLLGDLLEGSQPMLQFIDILAVAPGFGGQPFDPAVCRKIKYLYERYPNLPMIGCDGGISTTILPAHNKSSAQLALEHGANFLIAGTSLFGQGRDKGIVEGDGEADVSRNMDKMVAEVLRVRQ